MGDRRPSTVLTEEHLNLSLSTKTRCASLKRKHNKKQAPDSESPPAQAYGLNRNSAPDPPHPALRLDLLEACTASSWACAAAIPQLQEVGRHAWRGLDTPKKAREAPKDV